MRSCRYKIATSTVVTSGLVVLLVVFAIHLVDQHGANLRLDMTAENLYSLSDGTLAIVDKMRREEVQPIEMRLYFSHTACKSLPRLIKEYITYADYLQVLLKQYEAESEGRIRISVIDPVPDSDETRDAEDFGLEGMPINENGDRFFFGLVFENQAGNRDQIEFLWPERQETVEYEIARRITQLVWPQKKRIGVLSSLGVLSGTLDPYLAQVLAARGENPAQSWLAMQSLRERYEVMEIAAEVDSIPAGKFDLLVVVHPKNFGEQTLWAIDEWVTRGGSTLIFLDPFAMNDEPPFDPGQQPWSPFLYEPSSNLERLLAKWGLERQEHRIAADFHLAVNRPVSERGPAERMIVDLQIDDRNHAKTLSAGHPVVQGLIDLRFFLAGSLVRTASADATLLTYTPLISTTSNGSTLEIKPGLPGSSDLVFIDLGEPGKLIDHYEPGEEPVILAYEVRGRFDPLFPEGVDFPAASSEHPRDTAPSADSASVHKPPVPEEERDEARIMVFADVDFLSDHLAFQQTAYGPTAANDNLKVLMNAVDYLLGSEELMQVRSKATIRRPFLLFDEIEAIANRETLDREKAVRADISRFEEELEKKRESTASRNAALFHKQLRDEVHALDTKIRQAKLELGQIRKSRRAALEEEEKTVRLATLGVTPSLVLSLGLLLFFRRRLRRNVARRRQS